MFSIVRKLLGTKSNPIGVDFGSDSLRLAQVERVGNEFRLAAAASADVPSHLRNDPSAKMNFFVETTRDLLAQGQFKGRGAILALPAASMFIQHLRMAKMDEDALKKALPWEARGKLPIDPSQALLRHLVAGEVYQDSEQKNEVIVMAAGRELVTQFLAMASKARLDVIGMNVEPQALIDCFAHVYRRKTDADTTNLFVDIGSSGTRAIIARGNRILFARSIPIGGEHFNKAVAGVMNIALNDAKLLRIKLCAMRPALDEHREKQAINVRNVSEENSFALLGAGLRAGESGSRKPEAGSSDALHSFGSRLPASSPPAPPTQSAGAIEAQDGQHDPSSLRFTRTSNAAPLAPPAAATDPAHQAEIVAGACQGPLGKLIDELDMCRRYHESSFPSTPVDRLIFVGGEAKDRGLCQHIAREMALTAQVGDPLVRMGRISDVGIESGIDRRQPQPGWAVAIGLSMGPIAITAEEHTTR